MTPLTQERRSAIERLSHRPGAAEAITHCPEWLSTFHEMRRRDERRRQIERNKERESKKALRG